MLNGVGGGAGLDPDVRDRFGNTPLIVAAQNNRKRISKMCVRVGADVDAVNARGNAALHYCYAYCTFELGEYLVSKGADPEIRNADGQTPRETLTPEKVRALERRVELRVVDGDDRETVRRAETHAGSRERKRRGRERDGRVGIGIGRGRVGLVQGALRRVMTRGVPDVRGVA